MSRSEQIAKEMSQIVPTFLRHMFPYVFAQMELPPSQVVALVSIEEQGGCTLTQLKKDMHVSAPTVSGIVARLERDGYVARQQDEKDRRVVNVSLTVKGKGVVDKFRGNIEKRWKHILSNMPVEVGENAIQTIRRIAKGFSDGTI
ncbi:MAG TPA: MarR family transcriptional regulator [Candidatus Omnitrophota bacterium]|nr:MarR family transcriptional regulator [Candidatus Omnitrophota bacterium]